MIRYVIILRGRVLVKILVRGSPLFVMLARRPQLPLRPYPAIVELVVYCMSVKILMDIALPVALEVGLSTPTATGKSARMGVLVLSLLILHTL